MGEYAGIRLGPRWSGISRLLPEQVTQPSRVLHLDASRSQDITITGQGVSAWADRSPTGVPALQATDNNRMIYTTSAGRRCVSCDANRFASIAMNTAHRIQAGRYFYVFVALRSLETNAARGVIGRYNTQFEWGLAVTGAGFTDRMSFFVGAVSAFNSVPAPNDGRLRVLCGAYTLGSGSPGGVLAETFGYSPFVARNTSNISATAVAIPTPGSNPTYIGRYGAGSAGAATADLHEILIYEGPGRMYEEERRGMIAGLLDKWS